MNCAVQEVKEKNQGRNKMLPMDVFNVTTKKMYKKT